MNIMSIIEHKFSEILPKQIIGNDKSVSYIGINTNPMFPWVSICGNNTISNLKIFGTNLKIFGTNLKKHSNTRYMICIHVNNHSELVDYIGNKVTHIVSEHKQHINQIGLDIHYYDENSNDYKYSVRFNYDNGKLVSVVSPQLNKQLITDTTYIDLIANELGIDRNLFHLKAMDKILIDITSTPNTRTQNSSNLIRVVFDKNINLEQLGQQQYLKTMNVIKRQKQFLIDPQLPSNIIEICGKFL